MMKKQTPAEQTIESLRHVASQSHIRRTATTPRPKTGRESSAVLREIELKNFELDTLRSELQQARKEIADCAASCRDFSRSASIGCFMLDSESCIVDANNVGAALLGCERNDLIGRRFSSFLTDQSRTQFQQLVCRVRETGVAFACELSLEQADGKLTLLHTEAFVSGESQASQRQLRLTVLDISNQAKAEQDLRDERERFARLAATSPGVICAYRLRPDGSAHFPYASARAQEILGLRPEELKDDATTLFKRIHPEDLGHVQATITESARTMSPWRDEYRIVIPERGTVWIEGHSKPIQEADGSITWLGTAIDITARKDADRLVRESEIRFRSLFEQAIVGIAYVDLLGRFVAINDQFCLITDRSRAELLELKVQDITFVDDVPGTLELFRWVAAGGPPSIIETRYVRPDRSLACARIHASPIRDAAGRAENFWVVCEDVTARKNAETALMKTEAQMTAIVASAMDAIICVDASQRVVLFNAAAEQMFRCPAAEAIGQTLDKFIPEQIRTTHCENVTALGRDRLTNLSMSTLNTSHGLRTDGEKFPIEATISHVETPEGQIYTVIIRDISERVQRERIEKRQTSTLLQTTKALKALPEMDRFLQQLLAGLTQCLGADSASLWLYNSVQDTLDYYLSYENGNFINQSQTDHPSISNPLPLQSNPYWAEIVHTRQPLVVRDIEEDAGIPNRDWFRAHGIRSLLVVPLLLGDDTIGCVSIRSGVRGEHRAAEIELAQALAQQAALAVEMSRLSEQSREAAILKERNRMAQEIHDTLAQGFTGILRQLEAVSYAQDESQVQSHVNLARDLARMSLQDARRSVRALRPQLLDGNNLPAALADMLRQVTSGLSINVEFHVQGTPCSLAADVEEHLFRIGQEALTNAINHGEANRVQLGLSFERQQIRLEIRDDGKGFEYKPMFDGGGFGLIGMHERAEQIGGKMTIEARPGAGATITVVVPRQTDKQMEEGGP